MLFPTDQRGNPDEKPPPLLIHSQLQSAAVTLQPWRTSSINCSQHPSQQGRALDFTVQPIHSPDHHLQFCSLPLRSALTPSFSWDCHNLPGPPTEAWLTARFLRSTFLRYKTHSTQARAHIHTHTHHLILPSLGFQDKILNTHLTKSIPVFQNLYRIFQLQKLQNFLTVMRLFRNL